jgi:GNAT superfamily N-acetyltransferase
MKSVEATNVALSPVQLDDFEDLVALRIEAMRESLERIGRFDPRRVRERLEEGFEPRCTRHIVVDGQRVGFVAIKRRAQELYLEHFYILPAHQGRRIGSVVLSIIFDEADREGLSMRVGALRESDSNRFYSRHGFVRVEESEWDIYYVRTPR